MDAPAARPRRALLSRVSSGHAVMVVAGLLGTILTLGLLRAADEGRLVLVAARDLPAGTVLDPSAVRATELRIDDALLALVVRGDDPGAVDGHALVEPVAAGAVLERRALRPPGHGDAPRAMTVPLPRARALAGALEPGDSVDVIAVARDGARAGYAAVDVAVLAVDDDDGAPLGGGSDVAVTLAVDADSAVAIASALEAGTVTLVRATGAAPLGAATSLDARPPAPEPEPDPEPAEVRRGDGGVR